jgi:glycosyltransferase involved in cell wall biosynthesis
MSIVMPEKSVLLIGNFLSTSVGTTGHSEELARRLALAGWQVLTASEKMNRLARLTDMVAKVWRERSGYRVAHVEVWPARVRRLLTPASMVVVPSGYLMAEMRPYGGRFQVIPNALDLSAYPFRQRQNPQVRLLWLRAFQKMYNPRLALQVAAELLPEYPELQLIMAGPDKGDGSWQGMPQLARELGLADRVIFQERVPKLDVPAWLNRGDIFLNTTLVDNAPVTVTEAMACGLCVVSSNVGGISSLLEHEKDAMLVPSDASEAMVAAVRRILTEPGLAERLSRNARQKAEQFDWTLILPQWEALLTAVARGCQP